MRILLNKFKEVLYAVLPITIIVLFLHFTIAPLPSNMVYQFLIGALFIVLGLSIFLFGVDIGITPLGENIGTSLSKKNKLWLVVVVGLVLGFFVSVAEPDLQILAKQVESVTEYIIPSIAILLSVSVGIAIMLVIGLIRIVYNIPLNKMLFSIYTVILVLSFFVTPEFLAISFDSSGATTGALTVPFILALAVGVSTLKKDIKSGEDDSFGLVAITSTGAIIAVMLLGIVKQVTDLSGSLPKVASHDATLIGPFMAILPHMLYESLLALLPVVIIYILFQIFVFKFKRKPFRKIIKGIVYTLVGLVIFLTGVNAGFMDVGSVLGYEIARNSSMMITVTIGFVIGLVTILAEPAVHVLTDQIEVVTSGYVKKSIVLAALALGVGSAIALSVLRIQVPNIELWHYLLPGYLISLALSFKVPGLFVGIAFDSGGVASGPMTATFILAFTQGIAEAIPGADVLRDGFGMIALVAMAPIITLQILGLIVQVKAKRMVKRNG